MCFQLLHKLTENNYLWVVGMLVYKMWKNRLFLQNCEIRFVCVVTLDL